MKKKLISMLLMVALIVTMAVPAFAFTEVSEENLTFEGRVSTLIENSVLVEGKNNIVVNIDSEFDLIEDLVEKGYVVVPVAGYDAVNDLRNLLIEQSKSNYDNMDTSALKDYSMQIVEDFTSDMFAVAPLNQALMNYGYHQQHVQMNWNGIASTAHRQLAMNAMANWNASAAGATGHGRLLGVTANSSNSIRVNTNSVAQSHDIGQYSSDVRVSTGNARTIRFTITIFTGHPQLNTNSAIEHTMLHEFGHALGLADLTAGNSVMNTRTNPGYHTRPTLTDIANARANSVRNGWI